MSNLSFSQNTLYELEFHLDRLDELALQFTASQSGYPLATEQCFNINLADCFIDPSYHKAVDFVYSNISSHKQLEAIFTAFSSEISFDSHESTTQIKTVSRQSSKLKLLEFMADLNEIHSAGINKERTILDTLLLWKSSSDIQQISNYLIYAPNFEESRASCNNNFNHIFFLTFQMANLLIGITKIPDEILLKIDSLQHVIAIGTRFFSTAETRSIDYITALSTLLLGYLSNTTLQNRLVLLFDKSEKLSIFESNFGEPDPLAEIYTKLDWENLFIIHQDNQSSISVNTPHSIFEIIHKFRLISKFLSGTQLSEKRAYETIKRYCKHIFGEVDIASFFLLFTRSFIEMTKKCKKFEYFSSDSFKKLEMAHAILEDYRIAMNQDVSIFSRLTGIFLH